jgi:hypothetical protein
MTRSVFQKACPGCAAVISADTRVCGCGYDFHAGESAADGIASADSAAAGDDELFAAYLSARLEQARTQLDQLCAELAQRPHDHAKAAQVMHAIHDLKSLKSDWEQQVGQLAPDPNAAAPGSPSSATPGESFRAQQAARAAQIMEATQQAVHRTPAPWRGTTRDTAPAEAPRPPGKPGR